MQYGHGPLTDIAAKDTNMSSMSHFFFALTDSWNESGWVTFNTTACINIGRYVLFIFPVCVVCKGVFLFI